MYKHVDHQELLSRDEASLKYERGRLTEGDTLIVANLPNGARVYHPHCFPLDSEYRVSSKTLINTGSDYFKTMLGSKQQLRQRQLAAFKNRKLPLGVDYVLDLSPGTEEGEENLHLLSCPASICEWYVIGKLRNVNKTYIGGDEEFEFTGTYQPPVWQHKPQLDTFDGVVVKAEASSGIDNLSDKALPDSAQIESSSRRSGKLEMQIPRHETPPDYSLARHCASIERLLQIISGKEVPLDSAPKVWTIAMLAFKYQCAGAVVDNILSWLLVDNNISFVEIHPEAAYKLGIALKSPLLTRAAFSVLVSEEAMGMRPSTAPSQRALLTPLGRPRDDFTLGEDQLNIIQKAALNFHEGVAKVKDYLLDENMHWFSKCGEFQKLDRFRQRLNEDESFKKDMRYALFNDTIDTLEEIMKAYFRGQLVAVQYRALQVMCETESTAYRRVENWTLQSNQSFQESYSSLSTAQRWCTRQLWEQICSYSTTDISKANFWNSEKSNLLKQHGVHRITSATLFGAARDFNVTVFGYESRFASLPPIPKKDRVTLSNNSSDFALNENYQRILNGYYESTSLGIPPNSEEHLAHELSLLDRAPQGSQQSCFFSLDRFAEQARHHILKTCSTILTRPIESETLGLGIAEGITCLDDEEWRFLPLWAGGCDDGTGGVGTDIPAASEVTWAEMGVKTTYNNASTIGESRAGHDGATESVVSRERSVPKFDSSYDPFHNLAYRPRYPGASVAPSVSIDDSISVIDNHDAMSEISFPSTFNTSFEVMSTPSESSRDASEPVVSEMSDGMRELMSDDFMLGDSNDIDFDNEMDDEIDAQRSDDFEFLSDDSGDETETEK